MCSNYLTLVLTTPLVLEEKFVTGVVDTVGALGKMITKKNRKQKISDLINPLHVVQFQANQKLSNFVLKLVYTNDATNLDCIVQG